MDAWTLTLMFGVTAIWVALGGAVAYLAAASAGERTRTSRGR
jgi:ABC-type Fe3+ transport system permease subunit